MPIYEYECAKCKFYTEVIQKISEAPLTKCPSCGKEALKKLISAPVFRLKGGGWYETDFKGDGDVKRNLAGGAEAEEAKPAAADKDGAAKTDEPKAKAEAAAPTAAPAEKSKRTDKAKSSTAKSVRRSPAKVAAKTKSKKRS